MEEHDSPAFHTISNRDVWEKLILLEETVRINNNLMLNHMKTTSEFSGRFEQRLDQVEKRMDNLNFKYYSIVAGLIAVLGSLIASAVGLVPL